MFTWMSACFGAKNAAFLMTLRRISIGDLILLTTIVSRNLDPLSINIINDAFDDKTSDCECSVMGDNSASKYTGLII